MASGAFRFHKPAATAVFLFAARLLCAAVFLDIVRLMSSILHWSLHRCTDSPWTCPSLCGCMREPLGVSRFCSPRRHCYESWWTSPGDGVGAPKIAWASF